MSTPPQPSLLPGNYYHIYNRSNGSEVLFREKSNFHRFLQLYDKYISPIADTLAWVLMGNHFHVLIYIKEEMVYKYSKKNFGSSRQHPQSLMAKVRFDDVKWETMHAPQVNPTAFTGAVDVNKEHRVDHKKIPDPTRHFAHLCSSYTKYINVKYNRHGSLFQRPFKRKMIENETYLQRVILYIHNNPVHHGFSGHPADYPWSSYHTLFSNRPTKLNRENVIDLFGGISGFQTVHQEYSGMDYYDMDEWLHTDNKL